MSSAGAKAVLGKQESSKSHLQSASRRHREKLNSALEELGGLLPLPDDVKSKLDKLSVLKLSVSFFQTKNFVTNQTKKVDDGVLVRRVRRAIVDGNSGLSDISLEALDSMFIVFTESGDVFYVSENVKAFFGYSQTYLIHQEFEKFVHPEDKTGFQRCLQRPEQKIVELCREFEEDCSSGTDKLASRRVCFCSIRCHAGRQSSHVSPFYYRSFKFDGHVRPLGSPNGNGSQYGYFALCTPVNPASVSTSTPRELVQYYGCKMGLDLKLHKLDTRGTKIFRFTESEYMDISGYFFVNLEDISAMKLTHEQLMECGQSTGVFRLMTATGDYRWIKGRARVVYDKNGKPEFIHADNIILGEEDGPFYKSVQWEILSKWSADRAARKRNLAITAPQEGRNTNAEASPELTCSGVTNVSYQQDEGSPSDVKAEPLQRKAQAKETVHHGRPALPAPGPDSLSETIATPTPMEYIRSTDPVAELERAMEGDLNGTLPLGSQTIEEEVTILKSLLIESNNNDFAPPPGGSMFDGAMVSHTAPLSADWTGSSSVSSRRAAQDFSEQLQILKSYLIDEQLTSPVNFKATNAHSNRAHPYSSSYRKNGAKLSGGSQASGSPWPGSSDATDCSFGSLTANLSPVQPQTYSQPQAPLLSSDPSLPYFSAAGSSGGMPQWGAPVSQGGVDSAHMHLTHLDSPPGRDPAALLPATTSYTARSAMDVDTGPSRTYSTAPYYSCGMDPTQSSGTLTNAPSSHRQGNTVEDQRAPMVSNGYDGFGAHTPASGRFRHGTRDTPRSWDLEPSFDLKKDSFFPDMNEFFSGNGQRAKGNCGLSNGSQSTSMFMQRMSGVVGESGQSRDTYGVTPDGAYPSPCSYSTFPARGNYREPHSQAVTSASQPMGHHLAAGQLSLNHNQAVPSNQNPTRGAYENGMPMTNGYLLTAQNMGQYPYTGQNGLTKGDTNWPKMVKETSQGSLIHEPRGILFGVPLSKATNG